MSFQILPWTAAIAVLLFPSSIAFNVMQDYRSRTPLINGQLTFPVTHSHCSVEYLNSRSAPFYDTALNVATVNEETEHSVSNVRQPVAASSKAWTDDGFVFGLADSGLERPKGRTPSLVVEGDSLATQPYQVAVVALTFLSHAYFALQALSAIMTTNQGNLWWTSVEAVLLILASWVAADFGSGVLHWSVDNYGNGRTPVMGGIIAAFQGHHSAPWTITQRGFCNNVYKLCLPFGPVTVGMVSWLASPWVTLFVTFFCVFEILSQEFHKWAHQLKSETPVWVRFMQDMGITIRRKPHAQHHLAPFEGNYCIISGICNTVLDQSGFFRRLEHIVYHCNGVESNAWKLDAQLRDRTLRGDYGLPAASTKTKIPFRSV